MNKLCNYVDVLVGNEEELQKALGIEGADVRSDFVLTPRAVCPINDLSPCRALPGTDSSHQLTRRLCSAQSAGREALQARPHRVLLHDQAGHGALPQNQSCVLHSPRSDQHQQAQLVLCGLDQRCVCPRRLRPSTLRCRPPCVCGRDPLCGVRVRVCVCLCVPCNPAGQNLTAPTRELFVNDRVGGGDGFASGMFYGILTGRPPAECLRLGWAHGALLTTYNGDTTMVRLLDY